MENLGVSESIATVPSTANDSGVNVAITTMANSEVSPQITTELDIQSGQDFRFAASQAEQLEHSENEVFSDAPQSLLHVADENQNAPSKSQKSSREVKSLGSVNNAGRKESLAFSESSRHKRPSLDAAKKKYDDALSRVN